KIEPSTIRDRAVLKNRTRPGGPALKELWVFSKRGAKCSDGFLIFPVTEISVSQVAVQHRQIVTHFDGLQIRFDRLAIAFPLIPNGAYVVLRVGVLRICLHRSLVALQRRA